MLQKSQDGNSATQPLEEGLLEACRAGQVDQAQSLLEQLERSRPGYAPPFKQMMLASVKNDESAIVKFCLDEGASISDDVINDVALFNAFETYKLLISSGLDIDYPIRWLGDFLLIAVDNQRSHVVSFCLENGADPNLHRVEDSKTALAVAAENGSADIAVQLLAHGAELRGSGALVLAAEAGRLEMVKLLLDHGADVDEIGLWDYGDDRGNCHMGSALHKAVTEKHIDVLQCLLDRGADVELSDFVGRTPLQRARESSSDQVVHLLLEARGATK